MPTIYEIAKRADVSSATVSRVINNHKSVRKETREKVIRVLKEMNYHPHAGARSLRTKRTHMISLIISDIENQFFPALLKECKIEQKNWTIICFYAIQMREKVKKLVI